MGKLGFWVLFSRGINKPRLKGKPMPQRIMFFNGKINFVFENHWMAGGKKGLLRFFSVERELTNSGFRSNPSK